MGTNYYARKKKPRIVKIYDELHLGKSSVGWRFAFKETDEIKSYPQFLKWLEDNKIDYDIFNEYGEKISIKKLIKFIEEKQKFNNPDNFKYDKNIDGYRFSSEDFS